MKAINRKTTTITMDRRDTKVHFRSEDSALPIASIIQRDNGVFIESYSNLSCSIVSLCLFSFNKNTTEEKKAAKFQDAVAIVDNMLNHNSRSFENREVLVNLEDIENIFFHFLVRTERTTSKSFLGYYVPTMEKYIVVKNQEEDVPTEKTSLPELTDVERLILTGLDTVLNGPLSCTSIYKLGEPYKISENKMDFAVGLLKARGSIDIIHDTTNTAYTIKLVEDEDEEASQLAAEAADENESKIIGNHLIDAPIYSGSRPHTTPIKLPATRIGRISMKAHRAFDTTSSKEVFVNRDNKGFKSLGVESIIIKNCKDKFGVDLKYIGNNAEPLSENQERRRAKIHQISGKADSFKEYTLEGMPVIALYKNNEKLISLSAKFWEVI